VATLACISMVERGSRIVIRGVAVFDLMIHECNNRCIQWEEEKLDSDLNLKKKLKGHENGGSGKARSCKHYGDKN